MTCTAHKTSGCDRRGMWPTYRREIMHKGFGGQMLRNEMAWMKKTCVAERGLDSSGSR